MSGKREKRTLDSLMRAWSMIGWLQECQRQLAERVTALEGQQADDGVVDAVIYCGSERPDYGAAHPCGLPGGHDGEHSCLHAYCTVTWADNPAPVPQWRALVDGWAGELS